MTPFDKLVRRKSCSVPGCDRPYRCSGYCAAHYERWRKHGDALHIGAPIRPRGAALRFLLDVVLKYDGDECLIWPFFRFRGGYGRITWKGRRSAVVSRVVCEIVNGPPPTEKHEAAHSCGRGRFGCVAPGHLRWATRAENAADTAAHGSLAGTNNGHAKLSFGAARTIRSLHGTFSQRELAEMFGVAPSTISAVTNNRRWVEEDA